MQYHCRGSYIGVHCPHDSYTVSYFPTFVNTVWLEYRERVRNYKTRGIVIKRNNIGEADRRIVFFTERFGKIVAIAKGARRPKSRFAAGTNLFCESELFLARGKTFDIITEQKIINSHAGITDHLANIKNAYWVGELVEKSTHEREPSRTLYQLLSTGINLIEKNNSLLALDYFVMHWLKNMGYEPELNNCVVTRNRLKENDRIYFSPADGGVVCHPVANGRHISSSTLKLLRFLLNDWDHVQKLKAPELVTKQTHICVTDFTQWVLEKEIKSDKM